jgi:hypothetical protein
MALAFVEKLRGTTMGKAFRIYEVTHDGSATTIDASNLDLNYIDYAIVNGLTALSSVADYDYLSGTTGGSPYVTFGSALSASTVCVVQAWGW